jgi:hypothetical protein
MHMLNWRIAPLFGGTETDLQGQLAITLQSDSGVGRFLCLVLCRVGAGLYVLRWEYPAQIGRVGNYAILRDSSLVGPFLCSMHCEK